MRVEKLLFFLKFDSTLGTLTEIRFTAQINASSSVQLVVSRVEDSSQPFTAVFDPATPNTFVDVGLIYYPGGGSTGSTTLLESSTLSQIGITDGLPDDYSSDPGSNDISYSDQMSSNFGGFSAGGGMSLTTGSIFTTDSGFLASDFVGSGNVNGLLFLGLLQIDFLTGTLENVTTSTITPEISYRPGNLTLQYVFDPIPEPSFTILLGLCGLLGLRRSR